MAIRLLAPVLFALAVMAGTGRDCLGAEVHNTPGPSAKATIEVLVNGGFESGRGVGWSETSSGNYQLVTNNPDAARSGSWRAWLGGVDGLNESLSQQVTIPADAQDARLTFWYRIVTEEVSSTEYDVLVMTVADAATGATLAQTRLSNASATASYRQAGPHDLTSYRGRSVRVTFTSTLDGSLPTSFHIDDVSLTATTSSTPAPASSNYSDIWWNPNESGWGLTIADHETQLFAVWYTYRQDGSPTWFVIPGGSFSQGRRIFSGDAYQTTGPAYFAAFDPNAVTTTRVGNVTIDFAPPGQAAGVALFSYTIGAVSGSRYIQRQPFGNAAPAWGTDVTDIWWNPDESGWGLTLAQHGNNVFGVWFTYDASGQPLFVVMPGVTFSGASSFAGDLYTTRGPYFGAAFNPSLVQVTPAGSASVDVQSIAGQRRLRFRPAVFGSAVDKQVQRQPFGNPAPNQPPPSNPSLTVSLAGTGTGRVTSTPAGIDCPAQCTASFAAGTIVTLSASPGATSRFTSFTGTCSTPNTSCTLTLSAAASVTATFEQLPPASTLAITPEALDPATPGVYYSQRAATARGGQPPYTFLADTFANGAPPLGMGIDVNGNLTGTPSSTYTTQRTFTFGVCVRDLVQTLKCTSNTIAVVPPTASNVRWVIGDQCNISSPISYKFFDPDRNLVWPSASTHYEISYGGTNNHNLSCTAGALVCIGAQAGSRSWGVGFSGNGNCSDCCARCDTTTYAYTFGCSSSPPPGTGGVTGTWSGTWNRTFGGFGTGSYSMTWNLSQSGSTVSGSWSWRFNSCDGLCPDPVGTTNSGSFATGSVSGSTLSLMTTGGTTYTGTISGNTISGNSGGSFPGTFTMSR